MSNAGVIQTFGVNNHATACILSRTIGDTTIEYDTVSTSCSTGWGENRAGLLESISEHVSVRWLATPDETMRMRSSFPALPASLMRSSGDFATPTSLSPVQSRLRRSCDVEGNTEVKGHWLKAEYSSKS